MPVFDLKEVQFDNVAPSGPSGIVDLDKIKFDEPEEKKPSFMERASGLLERTGKWISSAGVSGAESVLAANEFTMPQEVKDSVVGRQATAAAGAFARGGAALTKGVADVAEYIGSSEFPGTSRERIGMKPIGRSELFDKAVELWATRGDELSALAKEKGATFTDRMIGEAIGGAVPGIAEFLQGVPYYSLRGAYEAREKGDSELWGATVGGLKRYFLGETLHAASTLSRPLAIPAMGTVMATQTAAEGGSPEEIASSFGAGSIYGATGPSGGTKARDLATGLKRIADSAFMEIKMRAREKAGKPLLDELPPDHPVAVAVRDVIRETSPTKAARESFAELLRAGADEAPPPEIPVAEFPEKPPAPPPEPAVEAGAAPAEPPEAPRPAPPEKAGLVLAMRVEGFPEVFKGKEGTSTHAGLGEELPDAVFDAIERGAKVESGWWDYRTEKMLTNAEAGEVLKERGEPAPQKARKPGKREGLLPAKLYLSPEEWKMLQVWENGLAPYFTRNPKALRWDKQVQEMVDQGKLPGGAGLSELVDYIGSYKRARKEGKTAKEFMGEGGEKKVEKAGEEYDQQLQERYNPTRFEGNQLQIGDQFDYYGERFEVVDMKENGVLIQDGQMEYIDNDGYFFADHGKIIRGGKEISVSEAGKFVPAEEVVFDREGQGEVPGVKAGFRLVPEEGEGGEFVPGPAVEEPLLPGTEKQYRDVGMGEEQGFSPEKGFRRQPEPGEPGGEPPMKRSDIVKFLREKFDIPIRYGKVTGGKGTLGIFKIKPEVIRARFANDIETISHEIGHALHKFMWPSARNRKGLKGDPFKAFEAELMPIATRARAGQDPLPEGFAEFVRRYITNDRDAKSVAPQFYSWFEAELSNRAPEAREILMQTRKDYDRWLKQPAAARILGQISVGESNKRPLNFDRLYTMTLDELHPLKKVEDAMRGAEVLGPADSPYMLSRLFAGWQGKADAFLDYKPFNFHTYKFEGKSLREILEPMRDRLDDLRIFLVAKRTLEKAGQGIDTGVLPEDAREVVSRLGPQFERFSEAIQTYQDSVLRYAVDGGLISKRDYMLMKKANKDYVPFYRVMEEGEAGTGGLGKGFEGKSPVKRMRGSSRDIMDPLESIIKNTYTMINATEKNAVGQALVRLAKRKEGMGKFVEQIPGDRVPVAIFEKEFLEILRKYGKWTESSQFTETGKSIRETVTNIGEAGEQVPEGSRGDRLMEDRAMEALTSRGWTKNEAEIILRRIKGAKTADIKSKIIERVVERTVVRSTVREFGVELPEGFVRIFRPSPFAPKGNVITVMEKGKANYYHVEPEVYRAFQGLDKESANMLVRVLSVPARLLRAGATLAPEFMARNPIRDQFSAFIYSKYGFVPGLDFMRGVSHMVNESDVYWQWKISGGEHAALVSMDREYLQKNVAELIKKNTVGEMTKTVIYHPIDSLRLLAELGEQGTRIGEFAKGVKKEGATKEGIQKSGFASREVTLDFQRTGAKTKAVNMIVAFWNANVQATDKMVRELRDNPGRVLPRIAASITIPSVLLAIANHDDPRWKEIPQWQKDLFWIVLTEKNIWRIPKPFEIGILFGSVPERFVDYALTKNPRAFDKLLGTIARGASPGYMPTFMNPFIENWANKSTFTDRPIIPRVREGLPPRYQYQPYTTEIAKKMGKYISKIPGAGDTSIASPAKIENLVRGWTGGLGMTLLQTADRALRLGGLSPKRVDPKPTLSDIPFIKGFVVRFPSSDAASVQQFYDDYAKATRAIATAKILVKKELDVEGAKELLGSQNLLRINGIHRALTNAHRYIELVYATPAIPPADKRRLIDETYLGMIDMAREGNRLLHSAEEKKR